MIEGQGRGRGREIRKESLKFPKSDKEIVKKIKKRKVRIDAIISLLDIKLYSNKIFLQ